MASIAYRDLGEEVLGSPVEAPSKHYPSVTFTKESFPELNKLDVGSEAALSFVVKVVSKEESENYSCVRVELKEAAVESVKKEAISKDVAIKVKNDADVALEAISAIKRTL